MKKKNEQSNGKMKMETRKMSTKRRKKAEEDDEWRGGDKEKDE